MIKVLIQPIDLTNEALIDIYKSVNVCTFDKWVYDDLKIHKDLHSQIPTVSIVCNNTGFNLTIKGQYNIELTSSIGHKSTYNTVDLIKCLFEIGAVKLNNN